MKTMHILSNSHLDREHRHEFQETRLMMVEMLDDVIRIMETDDSYRYLTWTGRPSSWTIIWRFGPICGRAFRR